MNAADYTPLTAEELAPLNQLFRSCKQANHYLRAVLELTYRCNFKCPHCYVHTDLSNHGDRERELSTAEWIAVIDQLADDGCLVLTFTGGEVLCRRDFFTLAAHARDRRFAVRIFTNASYIDDSIADKLAALNPLRVEVSLYGGGGAGGYRAIAGHEIYFEKTCAGIDRLVDRGVPIQLKAPLMRENFDEMDQMAALTRDRWGAKISFSPHMVHADDRNARPLESQLTPEQFEQYIRSDYCPPIRPQEHDESKPPCTLARDYLVISPFGDIFPCVNIKRSVGNVREQTIREIWHTAPFLSHLRKLTIGDFKPYYTDEEFPTVALCPGAVYRETGSPVGSLAFSKMAAGVCAKSGGRFSCGCH